MDELITTVINLLIANFPGSQVEIEEVVPNLKVGGTIIWGGFLGLQQIERQNQLWSVLRGNLAPAEQLNLGTMLTLTPHEVAAMQEMEDLAAV